tara:strand:+ start:1189 stop:1293 length:105 start_codon:yes stop_codon:yes gene_type:complete
MRLDAATAISMFWGHSSAGRAPAWHADPENRQKH